MITHLCDGHGGISMNLFLLYQMCVVSVDSGLRVIKKQKLLF
jgi:hypothetical protein